MEEQNNRKTGTVKWFNVYKGYGFIQQDIENEPDVFLHASRLKNVSEVYEGDRIEFNVVEQPKGLMATNIYYIGADPR